MGESVTPTEEEVEAVAVAETEKRFDGVWFTVDKCLKVKEEDFGKEGGGSGLWVILVGGRREEVHK